MSFPAAVWCENTESSSSKDKSCSHAITAFSLRFIVLRSATTLHRRTGSLPCLGYTNTFFKRRWDRIVRHVSPLNRPEINIDRMEMSCSNWKVVD